MIDNIAGPRRDAGTSSRYRRFLGTGAGSGLLGGICCVGSAIAVGAGVGGLGFFTTLMDRYQIFFIIGSSGLMAAWLVRHVRRHVRRNGGGGGFAAAVRAIWRQALTMAAVYGVTLMVAMAVSTLIQSA